MGGPCYFSVTDLKSDLPILTVTPYLASFTINFGLQPLKGSDLSFLESMYMYLGELMVNISEVYFGRAGP